MKRVPASLALRTRATFFSVAFLPWKSAPFPRLVSSRAHFSSEAEPESFFKGKPSPFRDASRVTGVDTKLSEEDKEFAVEMGRKPSSVHTEEEIARAVTLLAADKDGGWSPQNPWSWSLWRALAGYQWHVPVIEGGESGTAVFSFQDPSFKSETSSGNILGLFAGEKYAKEMLEANPNKGLSLRQFLPHQLGGMLPHVARLPVTEGQMSHVSLNPHDKSFLVFRADEEFLGLWDEALRQDMVQLAVWAAVLAFEQGDEEKKKKFVDSLLDDETKLFTLGFMTPSQDGTGYNLGSVKTEILQPIQRQTFMLFGARDLGAWHPHQDIADQGYPAVIPITGAEVKREMAKGELFSFVACYRDNKSARLLPLDSASSSEQ